MNMQQIFSKAVSGNKSTPAQFRSSLMQGAFGQKNVIQVLKASEKQMKMQSSAFSSDDDSDSCTDFDDLVLEQMENDQIEPLTIQCQVSMPSKLVIKSKNPDMMDDTPTVELVHERKPMTQVLFKTMVVSIDKPEPAVSKPAKQMQSSSNKQMDFHSNAKASLDQKPHSSTKQVLLQTAPEGSSDSPQDVVMNGLAKHMAAAGLEQMDDEVVQLYWRESVKL